MPTLTVEQFRTISKALFKAAGADDKANEIITDSLLWASLHGHDSHGAGHLAMYARTYLGLLPGVGEINKDGDIIIKRETPTTLAVDANYCLGQKVISDVTERIIKKAEQTGIAAATITRSTHSGALGYYTSKIVRQNMIGMVFTCAGAASPPFGGVERVLGTNPLSIGIPAKDEYPIIIDMATSATTWLGVMALMHSGRPLPPDLLLDDDGERTTDPAKFALWGQEPHGSIDNLSGNHKGYAIQLAVEMLGGVLAGLVTGSEVFKEGRFNNPCCIIVINIAFFQDLEAFKVKVDERIRQIKASKKKRGVDTIYLPGERGLRIQERRLKEGIPIHDTYWDEIVKLADEMRVNLTVPTSQSVSKSGT